MSKPMPKEYNLFSTYNRVKAKNQESWELAVLAQSQVG